MTMTSQHVAWLATSLVAAVCIAAQSSAHAAPPSADLAAGQELVQVGAMTDPTPPCISCHRVGGLSDDARLSSLAGQPASLLISRLHEYQARARAKPPNPLTMADVAAHLDEVQIRQVAAYLSTLPPR
jgi:cytochrome c553